MAQAHKYDTYKRDGPKVFVGEYAVTSGSGLGNLRGAIGEAAFMTAWSATRTSSSWPPTRPCFVNVNHSAGRST